MNYGYFEIVLSIIFRVLCRIEILELHLYSWIRTSRLASIWLFYMRMRYLDRCLFYMYDQPTVNHKSHSHEQWHLQGIPSNITVYAKTTMIVGIVRILNFIESFDVIQMFLGYSVLRWFLFFGLYFIRFFWLWFCFIDIIDPIPGTFKMTCHVVLWY